MAVTITGGKYSGAITSLSTAYELNDSSASFNSGDFTTGRIIGLWNSVGTTYKGAAWIRRWVSSTKLELNAPFIDKDGNTVNQTVGDTYLVSKNFADVVIAGIAVSGNYVTISDRIVFGTNGDTDSVCFYDENKAIVVTTAATSSGYEPFFLFSGGLTVFGFLVDFEGRLFRSGCNIFNQNVVSGASGRCALACSSTAAKVWLLGCTVISDQAPNYIGEYIDNTINWAGTPGEFQFYWGLETNCDILSSRLGGNWSSNAEYQQILNSRIFSANPDAILLRWGDGFISGGLYALFGSSGISVLGSDVAGTYNIGSTAGSFFLVNDAGTSTQAFWRSGSAVSQTIVLTNVVTPNRKFSYGYPVGSLVANPNANGLFKFSGLYTNLINGSLGLIKGNNLTSSIADSGTASGSQLTLTIQEASVVGHTETVTENSWVYGFYKYGYQIVSGSIAISSVTVTAGQTAKQVVFGGFVGQVADVNITQSNSATVAAYSQLENSDKAYDYAQYWKTLNTANAIYPAYNQQLITNSGGVLSTPGNNNIVFDSAAGSAFNVNTSGSGTITFKASSWTAGTKSNSFQLSANRTLTFNQNGDKSGFIYLIPATGTIAVADGITYLNNSVFDNGATISLKSGATSAIVYVDESQVINITEGAGVEVKAIPPVLTVLGFQPLSNVKISQAGRTLDVLNNTSPPYEWTATIDIPGGVTLTVEKTGYQIYTQAVSLTSLDQTITVAQLPEGATDTFDSAQFEFKQLMLLDSGFQRILLSASASLADEARSCALAQFENTVVKASWNALVAYTVPTSGEISAWQGYLTSTGYAAISFANTTGVVS